MAYRNFAGAWLPDTSQAGVHYVNGTWAGETVYGTPGNDQFEGGGGRDTLSGGAGDDFYWVRDTKDVVTEWAGGGVDTVKIWSSYTLSPNVENLIVFGGGSYAAGNDLNNIVQGLDGDQFLYGGRGDDVLVGGSGADTFIVRVGEGNEVIEDFQSWTDKIRLIGGNLTSFDAVKSAMTQQGSDVVLNNGGTMIAFRNAQVSQFTAQDFQLPLDTRSLGSATFNENFDSLNTTSVWKTNFGYAGDGLNSFTLTNNSERQIYVSPEFKGTTGAPLGLNPYSVNNGVLTITAQPVSADLAGKMWGYNYSSGMLISNYTQTYGYFEVRAELPHGQGLWPAFWMIGPNNNEIDILEGLGSDTKVPFNAIHSNEVPARGLQNFVPDDSGFHTYGALWSAKDIVFYVDGTEVWRTPNPSDMNKPMQMIVNLAVGGPWAGNPDGSTPWPAQMKIDYVRAYNLPDANYTPPPSAPPPVTTPPVSSPPVVDTGAGQVLNAPYAGATLTGGAGADVLNASQGSDTLTGGGGADTFVIKAMPWSAGRITDFTLGTDKLDLSALYANGYKGADPVADRYVSFLSDGAGGTKVMMDVDGPSGPSSLSFHVVTLQGIAPGGLNAGAVFNAATGSTTPPPATTTPDSGGAGQVLSSPYPGATLTGGAGADVLNASQGSDTLTGGGGADTFVIKAMPWSAGRITDFTVGADKLDLSGLYTNGYKGTDPVADRYVSFLSDGAGGTKVMMDVDGPSGPSSLSFHVVTLQGVSVGGLSAATVFGGAASSPSPSAPAPSPTPSTGAGQVLTSSYPGASLTGGAGADTLNASQGPDTLFGGAGSDYFAFRDLPWNAGHVRDFTPGSDVLDLRGAFDDVGYAGTDPIRDGYLRLEADGAGGTRILIDADGWGSGHPWPTTITTLDGVAASRLGASDWIVQ